MYNLTTCTLIAQQFILVLKGLIDFFYVFKNNTSTELAERCLFKLKNIIMIMNQ